jgi:hypothetical protein
MNAASRILDRLELARPTGKGRWIARCPAHEDRTPSLSLRETDDGRVLIYDFGGCHTEDVLAALGLELRDLFDQPIDYHVAPVHSRIPARDLLQLIDHELNVAMLLLTDCIEGKGIGEAEWQRLAQAAARIGAARGHAHGR